MNDMSPLPAHPPYRTVVISDAHLGTRGCKARELGDFLKSIRGCKKLIVVGDLIDGWALLRRWYWPKAHTRVVSQIMKLVHDDTQVTYVPGNHDEFMRTLLQILRLSEIKLGKNLRIVKKAFHETADGKKLLVMHGDEFDGFLKLTPWAYHLGDRAYTFALWLNTVYNRIRRPLGYPYWSLSLYLKRQVKGAVKYIAQFENLVAAAAEAEGAEGVLCGHIHKAEIRQICDVTYMNPGDWVESCSALVEHEDGRWEIIYPASNAVSNESMTLLEEGEAEVLAD
jgi:UDP-2,3-diacylglucosamine pyrophosphatase LpxH